MKRFPTWTSHKTLFTTEKEQVDADAELDGMAAATDEQFADAKRLALDAAKAKVAAIRKDDDLGDEEVDVTLDEDYALWTAGKWLNSFNAISSTRGSTRMRCGAMSI